jgi:hypothetical protein
MEQPLGKRTNLWASPRKRRVLAEGEGVAVGKGEWEGARKGFKGYVAFLFRGDLEERAGRRTVFLSHLERKNQYVKNSHSNL